MSADPSHSTHSTIFDRRPRSDRPPTDLGRPITMTEASVLQRSPVARGGVRFRCGSIGGPDVAPSSPWSALGGSPLCSWGGLLPAFPSDLLLPNGRSPLLRTARHPTASTGSAVSAAPTAGRLVPRTRRPLSLRTGTAPLGRLYPLPRRLPPPRSRPSIASTPRIAGPSVAHLRPGGTPSHWPSNGTGRVGRPSPRRRLRVAAPVFSG